MTDEIEDGLRRELTGRFVPFDEARADDMIRTAAEAGLAGTPRAWVAPLAAAAAVVVIGGGVAIATAGGGGNSAGGPAQPGGPGVAATSDGNANGVPGCEPIGSAGIYAVGSAIPVQVDSGGASVGATYRAIDQGSSAPDLPPDTSATATPVHGEPPTAVRPTSAPEGTVTDLPASEEPASEVPVSGATEPVPTVAPSDGIVICEVGTAASGSVDIANCSTVSAVNRAGHDNGVVVCVATASVIEAPPLPTEASGTVGTCPDGSCASDAVGIATPSSSEDEDLSIDTHVAPGESKTFDGPDIPPGKAFVVTAFVLQNPAADEGNLTIEGDAASRLSEALSNFRDVDFHLDDEAITYDAEHPLRVTVDCANTSTACTPAVLVSGHWTHD